MKRIRSSEKGLTLIEMMLVVVLSTLVILVAVGFLSQNITYFRATSIRNELFSDALSSRNTMLRFLRLGSAQTVFIETPDGTPPYSHIRFSVPNGTQYDFRWVNRTIQMTITPAGEAPRGPRTLASNVQNLHFVVPDTTIPTELLVTLRLQKPIDTRHTAAVTLADQRVQMAP